MTTIAATRVAIACDLQVTGGNLKFKCKDKIYAFDGHPATYPTPYMVGYAGNVENSMAILDWLAEPTEKPPRGSKYCQFLALTNDGKIFTFQNPARWIELDAPYAAIGSGGDIALGALASGKTPKEAVLIASKVDINTGMGVKSYEL